MTVATAEQEEQIDCLVRSFGPVIYKVAFAITRSRALAEEVVQDALFAAWTKKAALCGGSGTAQIRPA